MAGIISGKEIEVPKEVQNILEFDEKVLYAFQQAISGEEKRVTLKDVRNMSIDYEVFFYEKIQLNSHNMGRKRSICFEMS